MREDKKDPTPRRPRPPAARRVPRVDPLRPPRPPPTRPVTPSHRQVPGAGLEGARRSSSPPPPPRENWWQVRRGRGQHHCISRLFPRVLGAPVWVCAFRRTGYLRVCVCVTGPWLGGLCVCARVCVGPSTRRALCVLCGSSFFFFSCLPLHPSFLPCPRLQHPARPRVHIAHHLA